MSEPLPVRHSNAAIDDLGKIGRDLENARGRQFTDQYVDTLINRVASLAVHPKRYRERLKYGVGRRLFPCVPITSSMSSMPLAYEFCAYCTGGVGSRPE